jgi:hypothetical protein
MLLQCLGFGLLPFVGIIALNGVEAVQPIPGLLVLPGVFIVAKLAGAPCGATHVTSCSFWAIDLQFLNGNSPLLCSALIFDWLLYSAVAWFLSTRRFHSRPVTLPDRRQGGPRLPRHLSLRLGGHSSAGKDGRKR